MIYLDNAATSFPKPERVYVRMDKYLRQEAANPGRSGHRLSVAAESQIVQARSVLAKLFGAKKSERIVFTLNCTDSLNIAIKGVLKKGDHVVATILEHNSVLRPLNALEASKKITVTKVRPSKDGFVDPQEIKKALQKNTKLVVITHASNVIGVVEPIREIGRLAREAGVLLLVDAAQTAGIIPIDIEADFIDLLAFPGHKSLYGPPGTGGLYVGERVKLTPWREGGTGFNSESEIHPDVFPFVLEGGTPNSVGIAGLREGVEFILEKGIENMRAHEQSLVKKLRDCLRKIPGIKLFGTDDVTKSVTPVSFLLKGIEPQELSIVLDQSFEIATRAGLHCAPLMHEFLGTAPQGCVRFSPGFFNTLQEIDQAVDAVKKIQASVSS